MKKVKKYQKAGTVPPIYTSNPQDKRIQAYNDSLTVYNGAQDWNRAIDNSSEYKQVLEAHGKSDLIKKADKILNSRDWHDSIGKTRKFLPGESATYSAFPKPVQPVIYQKPQQQQQYTYDSLGVGMKTPKRIQGLPSNAQLRLTRDDGTQNWAPNPNSQYADITATPIPQKPIIQPIPQRPKGALSNPSLPSYNMSDSGRSVPRNMDMPRADYDTSKPTKYSFTYPTGEGQNGQKTIYFPTKGALNEFKKGTRGSSSQEGEDYMTATGYMQDGGLIDRGLSQDLYQQPDLSVGQINPMRGTPSFGPKQSTRYQFNPFQPNAMGLGVMGAYLGTSALLNAQNDKHYQEYKNRWIRDYSMPSLLQDPNKFSSEMYESPIYQRGGTLPPGSSMVNANYTPQSDYWHNYAPGSQVTYPGDSLTDNQITMARLQYERDRHSQSGASPLVGRRIFKNLPVQAGTANGKPAYYNPSSKDSTKINHADVDMLTYYLQQGHSLPQPPNPTPYQTIPMTHSEAPIRFDDGGMTMDTPEDQGAGYYKYPNASSLHFPGSGQRTFVPGPFPLVVKDQKGTQIMTNKPVRTYGSVTEIPMFEDGGEVKNVKGVKRKDATIEAEKGELIFGAGAPGNIEDQEDRVGAGLYKIGGQKHSKGGTPLKAYPGDFVFSNDKDLAFSEDTAKELTGDTIGKKKLRTPAALANKYISLNKNIKDAQDKDLDPITKKTAMLNINNFIDRLAEIGYAQEEKKGFPTGVPEFVQASLGARFDSEGLQEQLFQFRYGGEVKKYQQGNVVPEDIMAEKVNTVPPGYTYYGKRGNRTYYRNQNGELVEAPQATPGGTPNSAWEKSIIDRLKSGISPEELLKKKYIGPEGVKKYGKYYQPVQGENFVYTGEQPDRDFNFPRMRDGSGLAAPNRPMTFNQQGPGAGEPGLDQFLTLPNTKFDITTAEAIGLTAAARPSKSRYPTAFRNYEIQNAKALTASTGRPISEQPYLNAINRSQLGFDQNNNPNGAAGATRSLGAFQASLGAQNQAISQVYGQNIQRADARDNMLAQLEIADGTDRTQQFEKYDNKLEMLANNKEQETKDRWRNISNMTSAMQSQREQKALYNTMSDFYNIMPDNSIGFKPAYKVVDGKLQPYMRNMADLIKGTASSSAQFNPTIQLVQSLRTMGFDDTTIGRMVSRTWDDFDKPQR